MKPSTGFFMSSRKEFINNAAKTTVHSGEGEFARLVCEVFGRPRPAVSWLRGDNLVDSNNHVIDDDGAQTHALTITSVTEADFGNYTCSARNEHGREEKTIVLTGIPTKPEITSPEFGERRHAYDLSWRTQSFSKILQYRIRYRKRQDNRDYGKSGDSSWNDSLYSPDSQRSQTSHHAQTYPEQPLYPHYHPNPYHHLGPGPTNHFESVIPPPPPPPVQYPTYPYQDYSQTHGTYNKPVVYEALPGREPISHQVVGGYPSYVNNQAIVVDSAQNKMHHKRRYTRSLNSTRELDGHTNEEFERNSTETIEIHDSYRIETKNIKVAKFDFRDQGQRSLKTNSSKQRNDEPSSIRNTKVKKSKLEGPTLSESRKARSSISNDPISSDSLTSEKTQTLRHTLYGLEMDTTYQVTVSVENKYGWSELSDIFTFYTLPETTTTTTTTTTETYHPRPQVGAGDSVALKVSKFSIPYNQRWIKLTRMDLSSPASREIYFKE
ncbi:Immunoglobulin I-set [Trinorchestia longiramus]|nr:Immunoglobulin I-set [Trinorchestia longiramus]